jgi:tRNA G10  N-methylase Trm11
MVETASKNINKYDLDDFNIINLNAKYINESEILLNRNIDSIITE